MISCIEPVSFASTTNDKEITRKYKTDNLYFNFNANLLKFYINYLYIIWYVGCESQENNDILQFYIL